MLTGRSQSGAALLLLLLVIVIGTASFLTGRIASRSAGNVGIERQAAALAEAKQALLGYALTHADQSTGNFGHLPCPDIDTSGAWSEGDAHSTACGAQHATVMGRLPWKTLGLAPRDDGAGECLWYVVSGSHKSAAGNMPAMLNTDSAGGLQIFAADGLTPLAGATQAERAVAAIIAPGTALAGQSRAPLGVGVEQCGGNYNANGYLDADSGVDNAALDITPDALNQLIARGNNVGVNDQILYITRAELERQLGQRADLAAALRSMTQAVAECIADYGNKNPGGAGDLRLPWPAPVDLVDYRFPANYDDTAIGFLSGRVADIADDANALTGNAIANVITGCNSLDVPNWTAENATLWSHYKDHLFFAVADAFKPDAATPTACGNCLSVNGANSYAGIVMLAGGRLDAAAQTRSAPPVDADTKLTIGNYLEGRNAANHPNLSGDGDYESGVSTTIFNDVLYCIDPAMNVSAC